MFTTLATPSHTAPAQTGVPATPSLAANAPVALRGGVSALAERWMR